jgi:hypothetical protein
VSQSGTKGGVDATILRGGIIRSSWPDVIRGREPRAAAEDLLLAAIQKHFF